MEYVSAEEPPGDSVDGPSSLKDSGVSAVGPPGDERRILHTLSSDLMAVSVPSHTLLRGSGAAVVGGGGNPQLSTSHSRSAPIPFQHLQGMDASGGLPAAAALSASSGGGRRPPGLEEEDGAPGAGPSSQTTLLVHSLSGTAVAGSSGQQHLHPAMFSFPAHGAGPLLALGSASAAASANVSLQHQQLQQLHQLRQQHSSSSTLLPLTASPLLLGASAGSAGAAAPSDLSAGPITTSVSPHPTGLITSHFPPHPHGHAFLSAAPQHASWLATGSASFDAPFGSVGGTVAAAPAFASSSFSFSPSSPSVSTTAEAAALAAAIAAVKVEPEPPAAESEALCHDARPETARVGGGRSGGERPALSEPAPSSSESSSVAHSPQTTAVGAAAGECNGAMGDTGPQEAGASGKPDSGVLLSIAPGFGTAASNVADPGRPSEDDAQATRLSDGSGAAQGQLSSGGVATPQVHAGASEGVASSTSLNSSPFSVRPSVVPVSLGSSFSSFPAFPSSASALAAAAVESLAALAAAAAVAGKASAKAAPSKRPRGRPKGSKDRAPRSRSGACPAGTEGRSDDGTLDARSSGAPPTVTLSANMLASACSATPEAAEREAVADDRQTAKRRRAGGGSSRKKKAAAGTAETASSGGGGLSDLGGSRDGDAPTEGGCSEATAGQLLHPFSAGQTSAFTGAALGTEEGVTDAAAPSSSVFDSSGISTAATSSSDSSAGDGLGGSGAVTILADMVSHGAEDSDPGVRNGSPCGARGHESGGVSQAATSLSPSVTHMPSPTSSGNGLLALCDAERVPSLKDAKAPADGLAGTDDTSPSSEADSSTGAAEDRPGGGTSDSGCAEGVGVAAGDATANLLTDRGDDEETKVGSEDRNRPRSRPPLSGEAVAWCGLGMVRAGGIRRSYSASFKLAVVAAAEGMNSNTKAAKQMGVTESLVRRWRMQKNVLEQLPGEKLSRRGRKHGKYVSLEQQLCLHVCAVQQQEGRILKDTEMRRLASEIAGTLEVSGFKASSTWCFRFKRRWGLDRVQATAAAAAAAVGGEEGAPSPSPTAVDVNVTGAVVSADTTGKPGEDSGCEDPSKTGPPVVGASGASPASGGLCGESSAASSGTPQQHEPATSHQENAGDASLEIGGNGRGRTTEGVSSPGIATVLVGSGAGGSQQQDQLQQQLHQQTNGEVSGGPESVLGVPLLPQQLLGSQHLLSLEQHQLQHLQLQLHLQQPLALQDPLRPSLRPPSTAPSEEDGSVVLLTPEQQQQQAALEQRLIELQKQQEELERQIEQHRLHQQFDAQTVSHPPPGDSSAERGEDVGSTEEQREQQLLFRQQLLLQQHQQLLVHQQQGTALGLLGVAGFSPSSGTGAGHGNEASTASRRGIIPHGLPDGLSPGTTDGSVGGRDGNSMGEEDVLELKRKNTAAAAVAAFLPQHLEEAAAAAFAAYGTTQQLHAQVHVDARRAGDPADSLHHDVQGSGSVLVEQQQQQQAAGGGGTPEPRKGAEDSDISQSQTGQVNVLGEACNRSGLIQSETPGAGAFDEQQRSLETQHAHRLQQQTGGIQLAGGHLAGQRLGDQRQHQDSEGLGGGPPDSACKSRELECS